MVTRAENWISARPASLSPKARSRDIPRILLAEDNSIAAELLGMTAQRLGVKFDHAEDGEQVVEMARKELGDGHPYSLILMDIMMPVMDGLSAARNLRAAGLTPDELPIVAVTGAFSSGEVQACLDAGMQACLAKPVLQSELAAVFDTWLPSFTGWREAHHEETKRSLKTRYERSKTHAIERIEYVLATRDIGSETVDEIRNDLHKLAGTAGAFGEEDFGLAASRSETALIESCPENFFDTLVAIHGWLIRTA